MCNHANCSHDLNDSLDGLFDGAEEFGGRTMPTREALAATLDGPAAVRVYVERCRKCGGSGNTRWGPCFACKGKGSKSFRTSPEKRQAARESKAAAHARTVQTWIDENPAEWAWMVAAVLRGFEFAISLTDALTKYGYLTERQLAAVRKCAQQDAERQATRAAERAEIAANAPALDISRIEQAFDVARANKVRWPKLRLDTFKFGPAGPNSRNPGAVYVNDKDTGDYLGKIMGGRFERSRECTPDQQARIIAAASDPESAAVAYGRRYGRCSICGRELTVNESIDRAMGPVCAEKYGWA